MRVLHDNSITVRVRKPPKQQHKSYTYELKIQGVGGNACMHINIDRHCCFGYLT